MPDRAAGRRAAVLGHPIAHSLSPVLHRAAYAALGLDWTYDRVDVTGTTLAAFLDSLDESWVGLSLTMPLKRDVLPLLDEIDDVARATGAVNTVLLDGGRRRGTNTDVAGLVVGPRRARRRSRSVGRARRPGATARSAVAALARRGTTGVTAYARRPEAAADLVATAEAVGVALEVRPWAAASDGLGADVVVSTVVAGAADVLGRRGPGVARDAARRRLRPLAHRARRPPGRTAGERSPPASTCCCTRRSGRSG